MKEIKILQIDNRGRILIPQSLRKLVGLSKESKLMVIADSELNELKITSIGLAEAEKLMKLKITMEDTPGALGKFASALGKLNVSIIHSEGSILEKDKSATYIAIVQSLKHDFEALKNFLINKRAVLDVEMLPLD
ncbi:MAG: hypothetical protein ACTSRI_03675 [Promethearchaeota archaeon]